MSDDQLKFSDVGDASSSLWQGLVERMPAVTYVADFDQTGTLRYVSPQIERLLGHPPEAFLAEDELWYRCVHPEDLARVRAEEHRSYVEQAEFECEYRMVHRDGRVRVVWERDKIVRSADGRILGTQGVVVDMSELRAAEAGLRAERDRAERYLDLMGTIIVVLDMEGRVTLLNRAGHELLGHEEGALLGADWIAVAVPPAAHDELRGVVAALLAGDPDGREHENPVLAADGTVRTIAWRNTVLRDEHGEPTGIMGAGLDVTERRRAEDQVAYLAYHDPLTGLPNRTLLAEHLELALARARRDDRAVALLYLDLDDFKLVNDSLGHAAGDRLLTKVALRLRARLREADLLARHGGDEFLLLLSDLDPVEAVAAAKTAAAAMVGNLQTPFLVAGAEFHIGASVGISVFPRDAQDPETLMRHADAAMYQAKSSGRDEVRTFDGDRGEPLRRLSMTSRLRQAIVDGELILHWQPIVSPDTGALHALEALVRWQDPVRGLVLPNDFVPFAEETGIIERLGEHVVELVCRQKQLWSRAGLTPLTTLNVSPWELRRPGFLARLGRALAGFEVDLASMMVEITESAAMQDPERTRPALREMADTGMRIAIDDFGAGYSSLARLIQLPVHLLKIDRSFLAAAPSDPAAAAVLTAVVQLAQSLGMAAVAEGVETHAQREFLVDLRCPLAQGYLLGRPVEADALSGLLSRTPTAV